MVYTEKTIKALKFILHSKIFYTGKLASILFVDYLLFKILLIPQKSMEANGINPNIVKIEWKFEENRIEIQKAITQCILENRKPENQGRDDIILNDLDKHIKNQISLRIVNGEIYRNEKVLKIYIKGLMRNATYIDNIIIKAIKHQCKKHNEQYTKIDSEAIYNEIQNTLKNDEGMKRVEDSLNRILMNNKPELRLGTEEYIEAIEHTFYLLDKDIKEYSIEEIRTFPKIFNRNTLNKLVFGWSSDLLENKNIDIIKRQLDTQSFDSVFLDKRRLENMFITKQNSGKFSMRDRIILAKTKMNGFKELKYIAKLLDRQNDLPNIEKAYLAAVKYTFIDRVCQMAIVEYIDRVIRNIKQFISYQIRKIPSLPSLPSIESDKLDIVINIVVGMIISISIFIVISAVAMKLSRNIV